MNSQRRAVTQPGRLRAAAYVRSLREEEDGSPGLTIAEQRSLLRSHAEDQGWELVHTYEEQAEPPRTALQSLLNSLDDMDKLLVVKLDRLSKSPRSLVKFLGQLDDHQVGLVSLEESVDTGTDEGAAARRVLETLSRWEPLPPKIPPFVDFDAEWLEIVAKVRPLTYTSHERIAALCAGVEYIVEHSVPGDFVECGIGKGGSMMAVALTLLRLGVRDRKLHLFDTFETFETQPAAVDVDYVGRPVGSEAGVVAVSEQEVAANMASTGYDMDRVALVKGMVEETLPDRAPDRIALLRLDTDRYQSTVHELEHLYPRLVPGGILIVDDYGHFRGARQAVDEYFAGKQVFLNRIDYTGRLVVKPRA